MSSFGAVPLDLSNIDFIVSSANKCLEGVPGFGYALCRKERLNLCKGTKESNKKSNCRKQLLLYPTFVSHIIKRLRNLSCRQ